MTKIRPYALHSDEEAARLDRQARIIQIERFLSHIPAKPAGRILDAGCGSAAMARLLARERPDAAIVGLDIRESYLEYAQRKAAEESLANLELVRGSLLELPFPDGDFDVVWTCLVLHWLAPADLGQAIREIVRVVRPGGHVICAEPDGVGTNHYPIAPDLADRWSRVTRALFEPDMGRRLYPLMYQAGISDISVDIRPYFFHAFGEIDGDVINVILDGLRPAKARIADVLGSAEAAQRMLDDLVEQHQDPGTIFFPLWFVVAGRKFV